MLYRKFELIPIKFAFFMNFLSCSKIRSKSLYYIVQGAWPNFAENENERILNFYIFSDAYTCTYVV